MSRISNSFLWKCLFNKDNRSIHSKILRLYLRFCWILAGFLFTIKFVSFLFNAKNSTNEVIQTYYLQKGESLYTMQIPNIIGAGFSQKHLEAQLHKVGAEFNEICNQYKEVEIKKLSIDQQELALKNWKSLWTNNSTPDFFAKNSSCTSL